MHRISTFDWNKVYSNHHCRLLLFLCLCVRMAPSLLTILSGWLLFCLLLVLPLYFSVCFCLLLSECVCINILFVMSTEAFDTVAPRIIVTFSGRRRWRANIQIRWRCRWWHRQPQPLANLRTNRMPSGFVMAEVQPKTNYNYTGANCHINEATLRLNWRVNCDSSCEIWLGAQHD